MHFVVLSIFLWKMYIPLFRRKIPILILIFTLYTALILLCNYAYEPFSERIERSTKIVHLDQKETSHALTGRPKIWALSFAAFKENPITGIGARNFGRSKEYPRYSHPHHAHLEILVGSGVLGLVSFLFINLLIIKWWIKSSPASQMHAWPFISYLIASFFPLTSHRSIYATELSLITFLFAAMAMASLRDKRIEEID